MFNTIYSFVNNIVPNAIMNIGSPDRSSIFARPTSPRSPTIEYSWENLQKLFDELLVLVGDGNAPVARNSVDRIIEVIRSISEILIWDEQQHTNTINASNSSTIFDFFCERGIMQILVHLLNRGAQNREVKVQILQSMSLLITNLKRKTSMYFLFSNNVLNNQLINGGSAFIDGDESLNYYIALLKSISLILKRYAHYQFDFF